MCPAAALVLVAAADAADVTSGAAEMLARLDLDQSGVVSTAEYAWVDDEAGFVDLDRDRNGDITLAELDAWIRLTVPRAEDAPANPEALMAALQALTLPQVRRADARDPTAPTIVPVKAIRGPPPQPDPSVLLIGGVALAWVFASWDAWASFRTRGA
ncbi:MAG: hypothetical protein EXR71_02780 [Myxococcales bacterium]|nr:hypothetical protein [Myxococcales bacterium]